MQIKDLLTNRCARVILDEVRLPNLLTWISEESVINRKFLNLKRFRLLRFHQLVRLLFVTASWKNRKEFVAMGAAIFGIIWDMNSQYAEELNEEI
jgi:hypothetical protein